MKTCPSLCIALCLVTLLPIPSPAMEKDRDPGEMAKESAKMANAFQEEAKMWMEKAAKAEKPLSSDMLKLADWARSEADELKKASEAWENRQIRLADRFHKKAAEYCEKRGKLFERIKEDLEKFDQSQKAAWEGKDEKPHDKKPDEGKQKPVDYVKPTSEKPDSDDAAKEKPGTEDAAKALRDQINQLGE